MTDPLGLIGSPNGAQGVGGATPIRPGAPGRDVGGPSFKDVLMNNIAEISKLQQDAEQAIEDLQTGRRDDADAVMIAKQKADMAFKLLQQVRNKLVGAYDEIKQMRV